MTKTKSKYKRGYENGEQTIEIYEGKIDLILYNDKPNNPSFYFYRFPSKLILGEELMREVTLVHRQEVESYLKNRGFDYEILKSRLLNTAWEANMSPRDEM